MRNNSAVLLVMMLLLAPGRPALAEEAAFDPEKQARASSHDAPLTLENILERMGQAVQRSRERYRAYTVTRQFRTYPDGSSKPTSEVLAQVAFVPPAERNYRIVRAEGSERAQGVVRRILEDESKNPDKGATAISRQNYDFGWLGENRLQGHDCYLLKLQPRRKEKNLIDGVAWVDKQSYLVRRVEGEMAKTPSWWLKKVQVLMDFDDVQGQWLLMDSTAKAEVRIFGKFLLTMTAVDQRVSTDVAETTPPAIPATGKQPELVPPPHVAVMPSRAVAHRRRTFVAGHSQNRRSISRTRQPARGSTSSKPQTGKGSQTSAGASAPSP